MRSSLVLVGGRATRAHGQPKHLFTVDDKTFLEKQLEELAKCSDEIFIVSRDADQSSLFQNYPDIRLIHDRKPGQGPAGGIHAGAWEVKGEFFFVTACDMPFLSCSVISYLFHKARGHDAAVPVWEDGRLEPLCAVYRRDAVRDFYEFQWIRRLTALIEGIDSVLIPVEEIRSLNPDLKVFYNVNDQESLQSLKKDYT